MWHLRTYGVEVDHCAGLRDAIILPLFEKIKGSCPESVCAFLHTSHTTNLSVSSCPPSVQWIVCEDGWWALPQLRLRAETSHVLQVWEERIRAELQASEIVQ